MLYKSPERAYRCSQRQAKRTAIRKERLGRLKRPVVVVKQRLLDANRFSEELTTDLSSVTTTEVDIKR